MNLRKYICGLSLSFAVVLSAAPAFGWDETGHKITAFIAWQQLTPDVREKVIKIMRSAPEDSQLATFYMPYGSRSEEARQREFFMFAATWADVVRDREFDTRYRKYNNGNWHYFDTLWDVKDGKIVYLPGAESGGKLMEKLAEFDKVIRGSASDPEKAIAIAWLEHLIGDLHQPLHTTGRVNGDDTKGDQGGNLFALTPKGTGREKADNLHRFWDSVIGRNMPNTSDNCDADYLEPIARSIMKAYPYSKLHSRLANGKYGVWEKESVEISTAEVYKDVTRYEAPSDSYKKKALIIAQERIALAGYRMGELFNTVFGAPGAK
jgi:hypothetical protein